MLLQVQAWTYICKVGSLFRVCPVPNKPYVASVDVTITRFYTESGSCVVKGEVTVLGFPSLISLIVYVDVNKH